MFPVLVNHAEGNLGNLGLPIHYCRLRLTADQPTISSIPRHVHSLSDRREPVVCMIQAAEPFALCPLDRE
jgi:hypothetical protein